MSRARSKAEPSASARVRGTSVPASHAFLVGKRDEPAPRDFHVEVFRLPSGGLKAYAARGDNARFGDGLVLAHASVPGQPARGFASLGEVRAFVRRFPRGALHHLARHATSRKGTRGYVEDVTMDAGKDVEAKEEA